MENPCNGWIKLYRDLKNKAFYKKDSEMVHLWIHLLMKANFSKNQEEYLGSELYKCAPGEFTTGRRQLALETGINASKVERCLTYFEKIEQQIEQRKTRQNRLIIINNWEQYQQSEPQSEPQVDHKWTTSEPQVDHPRTTNAQIQHIDNKKLLNDAQKKVNTQECKKERMQEIKKEYMCKFDKFYSLYPKKRAKQSAIKAWMKLKLDDNLFSKIINALNFDIKSEQWNKDGGEFIPLPASWINGKRWEDSHEKIETKEDIELKKHEEFMRKYRRGPQHEN